MFFRQQSVRGIPAKNEFQNQRSCDGVRLGAKRRWHISAKMSGKRSQQIVCEHDLAAALGVFHDSSFQPENLVSQHRRRLHQLRILCLQLADALLQPRDSLQLPVTAASRSQTVTSPLPLQLDDLLSVHVNRLHVGRKNCWHGDGRDFCGRNWNSLNWLHLHDGSWKTRCSLRLRLVQRNDRTWK